MKTAPKVLVIEDQSREKDALIRLLRSEGYNALGAANRTEASIYLNDSIDLVICDLRLGLDSGINVLKEWRERGPSTPFIMATAYGDVDTAVAAMKLGAIDYLTKPLKPDELLLLLNRYLPMRTREKTELEINSAGLGRIIGQSQAMRNIFERIQRVAESESIVLITGESGTGKELVASAIHRHSKRKDKPYVAINVSAFPESLVEAELFGHVKGAFTNAQADRTGRFQAAHEGTLFMDEIGDFPLSLQPKLLRVLENLTFCPVGSNEEIHVDVRLIAATSRNISELIAQEQYRADLFHRINVLTIELPSLRDRPEDIPALVSYFLQDCSKRHLREAPQVDSGLMEFLQSYDWPGNVRQLRNAIENMVVMGSRDVLTIQDIPKSLSGNPSAESSKSASNSLNLNELEREAIMSALHRSLGNRTHAAQKLGISVRTLQRKLRQWGVESAAQGQEPTAAEEAPDNLT